MYDPIEWTRALASPPSGMTVIFRVLERERFVYKQTSFFGKNGISDKALMNKVTIKR